jgi:hypothetical protein
MVGMGVGRGEVNRKGRETNPFPIRVLVFLVRFIQVYAVEAADSESHDDLYEAEDGVQDVGEGHFGAVEDAHFGCVLWLSFFCSKYR